MADHMEHGGRCEHGIRGRCLVCENDQLCEERDWLLAVVAHEWGLDVELVGRVMEQAIPRWAAIACTCRWVDPPLGSRNPDLNCPVHGEQTWKDDGSTLIVSLDESSARVFAGSDYDPEHFPEVQPIRLAVCQALEANRD